MTSLKPTIVGLGVSMPVLAVTAVMLRIKARRMKKLDLGADDYTIIAALVRSLNCPYRETYLLLALTVRSRFSQLPSARPCWLVRFTWTQLVRFCLLRVADVYYGNLGGHRQNGPGGIPENKEAYVNFSKVITTGWLSTATP